MSLAALGAKEAPGRDRSRGAGPCQPPCPSCGELRLGSSLCCGARMMPSKDWRVAAAGVLSARRRRRMAASTPRRLRMADPRPSRACLGPREEGMSTVRLAGPDVSRPHAAFDRRRPRAWWWWVHVCKFMQRGWEQGARIGGEAPVSPPTPTQADPGPMARLAVRAKWATSWLRLEVRAWQMCVCGWGGMEWGRCCGKRGKTRGPVCVRGSVPWVRWGVGGGGSAVLRQKGGKSKRREGSWR